MHAIIGFTNILLREEEATSTGQTVDFLERILINAKDQLGLINSILDLSKVEAGKMEVQTGAVALDVVIREVVKQLEVERPKAGVEIVLRVPDMTRPVSTDGPKLKQVLINLIDNALKFTDRGTVTVELVMNQANGVPFRINVTDTGLGIPAHQLKEIFEPFQQLQTEAGQTCDGTGLGLSISRSLCHLLGFNLQVESKTGRGSTFSILLNQDSNRLPISA